MTVIRYYSYGISQTIFILFFALFTTAHAAVVRFYDENLSLVETRNYEEGSVVNFSTESGECVKNFL
jgi:hypothetical protein